MRSRRRGDRIGRRLLRRICPLLAQTGHADDARRCLLLAVKRTIGATSIGVTSIILGLLIIGGISFTYTTRPMLIEAATKLMR